MKSFVEFVAESLERRSTNILFEAGMYSLADDLERILSVLRETQISFELIGGAAVLAHIMKSSKGNRSFLTKDLDFLIRRSDLEVLLGVAGSAGYRGQRIIGGYALVRPNQDLGEAVHLIFVGEKPNSAYPVPSPPLNPEVLDLFGLKIPVAPLNDLITLKLNSMRAKDEVHLEILDRAGLITPVVEAALPPALFSRLLHARARYEDGRA